MGDTILFSLTDAFLAAASSSALSASGSYPSLSILSASSFAFFSAASKSISSATTFFAPNFWVFFALRILRLAPVAPDGPFLTAEDEVVRMTAGAVAALSEDSPAASGDLGRSVPLPLAIADRKGDAVLERTGVPVREGGLLGLLIVGLSHDEKKSLP